jgi:hypothetical protein
MMAQARAHRAQCILLGYRDNVRSATNTPQGKHCAGRLLAVLEVIWPSWPNWPCWKSSGRLLAVLAELAELAELAVFWPSWKSSGRAGSHLAELAVFWPSWPNWPNWPSSGRAGRLLAVFWPWHAVRIAVVGFCGHFAVDWYPRSKTHLSFNTGRFCAYHKAKK